MTKRIKLYGVAEAAAVLNLSQEATRRWIRDGRLPTTRLSLGHVMTENDLDEFRAFYRQHEPAQRLHGTNPAKA